MATTENKRYLDLEGLSHLIEKLKDEKRIIAHPDTTVVTAAAVKVGHDADGHVVLGDPLKYSDLQDLPTIGNGTLTIKANGTSKGTFTANQVGNSEIDITAADLGLSSALSFAGTTTTDLTDGATTNPIKVNGKDYTAISGNVVLYNNKEFIWNGTLWEELGDEASHALKSIKIEAGEGLTGGGTLEANRTISHATTSAVTAAPVKIGRDELGHVVIGTALTTAQNGKHGHTVSATIGKDTFLKGAGATTTKISLNKSDDTFVKSYSGVTSKLVTTTVTGTDGTVTASKATAGTAKDIAKVGSAVTYGTADCGTTVTKVAQVGSQITYGGANVGSAESVAYGVKSATASVTQNAYTASYSRDDECLTLTPATISVTPTVTLDTKTINPAVASSATAYVCADGTGVSIIPAKESTKTLTPAADNGQITPYTFTDVIAAKKAASATVIATGELATDGAGDSLLVGLGTATTASALTSATIKSDAATGDVTVATGVTTDKYTSDITISGNAAEAGEHNHTVQ